MDCGLHEMSVLEPCLLSQSLVENTVFFHVYLYLGGNEKSLPAERKMKAKVLTLQFSVEFTSVIGTKDGFVVRAS